MKLIRNWLMNALRYEPVIQTNQTLLHKTTRIQHPMCIRFVVLLNFFFSFQIMRYVCLHMCLVFSVCCCCCCWVVVVVFLCFVLLFCVVVVCVVVFYIGVHHIVLAYMYVFKYSHVCIQIFTCMCLNIHMYVFKYSHVCV